MRPGDVLLGRFAVEERVGSGGMATVYRARDRATGQPVALKVAAPGADPTLFAREVELYRSLSHPGMAAYVAHGVTPDGAPFLALEWLDGEDLAARIARAPLGEDDALRVVLSAARTLGHAHARGLVHRDVKPSNLLLEGGDFDRVRVLDFGVATPRHPAWIAADAPAGTPAYMAPEQARGARDVGPQADVFSLGCVLHACLTGRPPFDGDHAIAVLARTLLDEPPRLATLLPAVHPAVDRLVARMLAKRPEDRPPDGAAAAREVAEARERLRTRPASVPPGSEPLTGEERRLAFHALVDGLEVEPAPVAGGSEGGSAIAAIRSAAVVFGARIDPLGPGSLVATLPGSAAPADEAARAARFVLAVRAVAPAAAIALVASRESRGAAGGVGAALDRCASIVGGARGAGAIAIDDVTASLLDARFEVRSGPAGRLLAGEQFASLAPRTLLGRPTPCIGRDAELRLLRGLYDASVAEPRACAAIVTAPAGVGKSRLLKELLDGIGGGAEVWVGRGDPVAAGAPFALVARALRRAADVLDGEPIERRREKLRARVARSVPPRDQARVAEFIGELVGSPFDAAGSVLLRAARRDAALMGDQMRRAFEDLVLAELERGPLVLALEDLHWGDGPSLAFVDAALRGAADRPLFVIALGRPEVDALFPVLFANRGAHALRLRELRPAACERLVRAALGDAAPASRVAELARRSAGNPFTLEELVRAETEGGDEAPPESVLAMVGARLDRLGPEDRRVARAASVFGEAFTARGVAALAGDGAASLSASLARLVAAELVAPLEAARFAGDEAFVFRHALVRDASYAALPDAERERGHALAGAFLERAGEPDALVLARHFERGSEPGRAIACWLRAARQALEGNDLTGAIERARHGALAGAAGGELGALELVVAEASRWRGDNAGAAAAAARALAALEQGATLWYGAAGEAAVALGKLGRVDELLALARTIGDLAPESAPLEAVVNARARAAAQLVYAGRYELADALLAPVEVAADAARSAEPAAHARLGLARALRLLVHGDPGAEALFAEAALDFDAAGDGKSAANARMNRGCALLEVAANAEAEAAFREVLAGAEALHLEQVAAVARLNLGVALGRRGALDEALTVELAAVEALAAQGHRRMEGAARGHLAAMLLAASDVAAAEVEARAAVAILEVAPPLRPQARATLARVLLASSRAPAAAVEARRAVAELEALGGVEEGEALVRVTLVEALGATGAVSEAEQALVAARASLLARASRLRSPELRQRFLEEIPEHARTMALARFSARG